MIDLKDHIITAVEIAEAAGTAVIMYPNQVRYLLDRIAVLEERCNSVEERAATELAIRNTQLEEWERKSKNNGLAAMIGLGRIEELEQKLQRERDASNKLLASISSWAYKSAGQTLPNELSEAVFAFEETRR